MTVLTLYRAAPATDLIVRALDDMTLVYHRRSGQTHMVASPVPEILEALGANVSDAQAIVATLSVQFDLGDPAEALPVIVTHLDEMVALGLVHRA